MTRVLRSLMTLLPVLLLFAAAWVLHHELAATSYSDVAAYVASLSWLRLAVALLFTISGYLVLTAYDTLGARQAEVDIPWSRTALRSFVSYGFRVIVAPTSASLYRIASSFRPF